MKVYNGLPQPADEDLDWIESVTKTTSRFRALFSPARQASSPNLRADSQIDQVDLPARSIVERLLDDFSSLNFGVLSPIIDRGLFQNTMDMAFEAHARSVPREALKARASIFAFIALAALHCKAEDIVSLLDCEACARKSELLLRDVWQTPDSVILQTLIMLVGFLSKNIC